MNALAIYSRETHEASFLDRETEQELAKRYRNGDLAAGNRIVTAQLRYVMKIASSYRSSGQPLEDLIQEGNLGLLAALRKFDPERGIRFVTYAAFWVHAKIRLYLLRHVSLVKFGTNNFEKLLFSKITQAREAVYRSNPDASDDDIAERVADDLSVDASAVALVVSRMRGDHYLDAPIPDSTRPAGFIDLLPDPLPLADERYLSEESCSRVRDIAERCARSPREHYILKYRLLAQEPATLDRIGSRLGVSRERVRQIERSLTKRIAAHMI